MIKNEIQEQRMRGYFIQATREILKGEGLVHLSVRNIAEKAGYSYATLYNYFKDVQELVFLCVRDFQDECREFVGEQAGPVEPGLPGIRKITEAYIRYFMQYPSVFELFFIARISDIEKKQPTTELIYNFFDTLTREGWAYCVSQGEMTEEEAASRQNGLKLTITGLLLFYLHRRQPADYQEFLKAMDGSLSFILG
ncbi:MAG: TetR/AcrR family transcriptional regulator [Bacteroidales bacterium]